MTTNDALAKHNLLTKLILKDGSEELSRELKVKVMNMRIEFGKVRKQFDSDVQEFVKEITPKEFHSLQSKQNKTEEDNAKLNEIVNEINSAYMVYVNDRGNAEVDIKSPTTFTPEEWNELVVVNAGNDVEINGQKIQAADFLEIISNLFVE